MSWRDRLTPPIGTIGTIGTGVFPSKVAPADVIPSKTGEAYRRRPCSGREETGTQSANGAFAPGSFGAFHPTANSADSANSPDLSSGTAAWTSEHEERAAIVQHDGEIPRAWAEGFARLDPDNSPADVPPKRWVRFIDDVGAFLDSPFCAVAAALSWGPFDLFGCDRDAPFARIDCAGLLWLLNGDRLIMLADDAATIETQTGVRRTWRRKSGRDDLVLAWELAS